MVGGVDVLVVGPLGVTSSGQTTPFAGTTALKKEKFKIAEYIYYFSTFKVHIETSVEIILS